MTTEGVDFANPRPSGAALKAAGKHFVIRYTSPNTTANPRKRLTAAEVKNYRSAGLDIGLVWETSTDRATQGRAAGVADAHAAETVRRALGIPSSVAQYFVAQDQPDITGPQVVAYFQGVASAITLARTGAYAGYSVTKYLFDHRLITYGWQTYAWSNGLWDPRAQVQQYHNGVQVAGVTVDLCRAMVTHWGQWAADSTEPPEDDMTPQDIANAVWHSEQFNPRVPGDASTYQDSGAAWHDQVNTSLAQLKAAVAAIPTTTLPAGPLTDADKDDIARRVADLLAARLAQ
ncbi:MAG TPA: glycoside hydrolase domain-containing protein [Micromonosporaceae bacterium]|jgi:hypothetical protein|nr:glycoside hydrolase domain-containing protein [Micromonosporaceae bacterium]